MDSGALGALSKSAESLVHLTVTQLGDVSVTTRNHSTTEITVSEKPFARTNAQMNLAKVSEILNWIFFSSYQ